MSTTEINELRQTIAALRQSVNNLRAAYGDASAIRRLENDVERLDIDASELAESPPPQVPRQARDVIYVPDSRSDESAWMGAQDEGLGFHSRERTK
ncbi:hypothetical protein FOS14_08040 [Skermania sp. ID1734]|uniref:hypothetical protein n=1 Tax=Skermania sp. ID1734 TaxID=2597516 RepID=UPI00118172CF|nr:hypothetical protein [Skermania sp. ID1734]TSE00366.1 hypothetical protein FOS14_08040 [Skermania sp. ID1734]